MVQFILWGVLVVFGLGVSVAVAQVSQRSPGRGNVSQGGVQIQGAPRCFKWVA